MDVRLQKRYLQLVESHMNVVQAVAAGIKALPRAGSAFAATQAAWRFFANQQVTLGKLIEPLREVGRQACDESHSAFVLLVHDWSKLDYDGHKSKKDLTQLSQILDQGYEQATALLVDAHDGAPLAPMGISVLSADGLHTTEADTPQPRVAHLEQILPWMETSHSWGLSRTCVHVIDREADSLKHMRSWDEADHLFLVRADDRRVKFRGDTQLLSKITEILQQEGAFAPKGEVSIRGRKGQQWIAETEIVVDGPAWGRTPAGKTCRVPGHPLWLRLVVVQVRDAQGQNLAEWLLLTNVRDVSALQIAFWYYWRWQIESFHKLLKSAGLEVEEWQQENASAIAKRLLIGCMASVTVWALQRAATPEAHECQRFLVRLSGRQMKRSRPVTAPALLAGLHLLLKMLDVLEEYTPAQLRDYASRAAPLLCPSG
jgi:Transposase DDE domain